jgi:hypothetical protein
LDIITNHIYFPAETISTARILARQEELNNGVDINCSFYSKMISRVFSSEIITETHTRDGTELSINNKCNS